MINEDGERVLTMAKGMLGSHQYELVATEMLKEALVMPKVQKLGTFKESAQDLIFYSSKHAARSERNLKASFLLEHMLGQMGVMDDVIETKDEESESEVEVKVVTKERVKQRKRRASDNLFEKKEPKKKRVKKGGQ